MKIKMYSACGYTNFLRMGGIFLRGYVALHPRTRVYSARYYAFCEAVCSKKMHKF